jgi:hypothetical protein
MAALCILKFICIFSSSRVSRARRMNLIMGKFLDDFAEEI